MAQDITRQIDQLRRRLQWRRALIATSWFVVAVVACVFALSGTDWLLGVGNVTGRVVCTLALMGAVLLSARRWFIKVWQRRVTSVSVAHCIEQKNPELRDIVTSALHFNRQSPFAMGAGSESLRRAVVLHAAASVSDIDRRQFFPQSALRQALWIAGAVSLVVFGLIWLTPCVVNTSLTRLLNPWSTAEWPRVNDLQFINPPSVLAAGDDLVIRLRDTRGSLPASIQLLYRVKKNGRWKVESQTFATTGSWQEVRLANVRESLEYRATGGDHHTMRWHTLEVVSPPRVYDLRVMVRQPAYTGLSKCLLEEGEQVLAGSRLFLTGKIDSPVESVVLRGQSGLAIPAEFDDDGEMFHTQADGWRIESSEVISFEIVTAEGLKVDASRRLTLDVVQDQPPRVEFVEPAKKLMVTPTAVVPVVVDARDDLAIRDIQLRYHRTDRLHEGDQQFLIFKGPESAPTTPEGRHRRTEYLWQLETLKLKPGTVLEVDAQASDYQPATGKTVFPRRLLVVSEDELLHEIAEQEANLIEILLRLKRQQSELRSQTSAWALLANLDMPQQDKEISLVLSRQRQLTDTLVNDRGGVMQRLNEILADFDRNGLYRPESKERLLSLHQVLNKIASEPLPAIEQLVSDWLRHKPLSIDQLKTRQRPHEIVTAIVQRQDEVVEMLQQAIDLVTLENTLARYENEVAALQTAQRQLAELSRQGVLSEKESQDAEMQRAWQDAKKEQRQLSRDLAKLVMRMSRSAKRQSALAGQLSDVVSLAQKLGLQTTMQTAADHLGNPRLRLALSLQQQAVADLQKMRVRLTSEPSRGNKQVGINAGDNRKGENGLQAEKEERSDGNAVAGSTPKESSGPTGRSAETPALGAKMAEDLVRDLWGHLPERQREQILQPLKEEFLPMYAPEIEAYFRALAEPEGTR